MFETAIVEGRAGQSAAGFSSSLMLQCGVVSGLVMASLFVPIEMPAPPELVTPMPMARMPKAVRVVSTVIERGSVSTPRPDVFVYRPQAPTTTAARSTGNAIEFGDLPNPDGGTTTGDGIPLVGNSRPLPEIAPPAKPPAVEVVKPIVTRVPIGGDVMASKLIHRVQPIYPEIARRARIEGVVKLHGVITKEGRIAELRVISGHPLLTKAALDAVSQWLYSPTLLNQQPVEVEAPIEVRFILGR